VLKSHIIQKKIFLSEISLAVNNGGDEFSPSFKTASWGALGPLPP
jgi:hypothetical protein